MVFLLTGGAGYIGTNIANLLIRQNNNQVIVFDIKIPNLVKKVSSNKIIFVQGDCKDEKLLTKVITENKVDVVIHLAASISVGESQNKPIEYYENNLFGTLVVLRTMHKTGVKKMIFSSTAAVYGQDSDIFGESMAKNPINAYGSSKSACEDLINYCENAYNINCVALRYFNVAGAGGENAEFGIWNKNTSLLIPKINAAIINNTALQVFGNNYAETGDGTCIRDYIHVSDLATAHLLAIDWLIKNQSSEIFNVASGEGHSVLQCIHEAEKILQTKVTIVFSNNRPGDPPKLIGDITKIKRVLHWQPSKKISDMIMSDYLFRKNVLK